METIWDENDENILNNITKWYIKDGLGTDQVTFLQNMGQNDDTILDISVQVNNLLEISFREAFH